MDGLHYVVGGAYLKLPVRVDSEGYLQNTPVGLMAGERNSASALNSYLDIRQEGVPVLLTGTGAAAIGGSLAANDTHLMRITIHTALAGTLTIAGFADTAAAAQNFVYPIATPAGVYEFGHALNTAGQLIMTLSNAADNNKVMVQTRPR